MSASGCLGGDRAAPCPCACHRGVAVKHFVACCNQLANDPLDLSAASPLAAPPLSFQARVRPWMLETFGAEVAAAMEERCDRHLEEVLELLQSKGYDPRRVAAMVRYVWSRPVGEPSQEVGGVMVTLAALCLAAGIDMHAAGETELARILRPEVMEKIRAKQAAKPKGSALPIGGAVCDRNCDCVGECNAGLVRPGMDARGSASMSDYHRWLTKSARCEGCRFYSGSACMRHAPTNAESNHAGWPYVPHNGWCGDFEPKPPEPKRGEFDEPWMEPP